MYLPLCTFNTSEAYLEGMKTQQNTLLFVTVFFVRSLPRRNENAFAVPSAEKYSSASEAYLEGMKTFYVPLDQNQHPLSEAYLEGMKTRYAFSPIVNRVTASEAYLEGMKTGHN